MPGDARQRFYTVEKIGKKRFLTPEGFLVLMDVPVARTGTMLYSPDELPLKPGPDGVIKVIREGDEVFRPEFLASLLGKAVVDDHPDEDVIPLNWRTLACGTAMNPRRGTGIEDDLVLVDLMVTVPEAIAAIQDGKIEISLGYDATYDEDDERPGVAIQKNLIANHIALVESGRCGPRCAIGDKRPTLKQGAVDMKTRDKADKKAWWANFKDRLATAIKAKDEAEIEKLDKEAKDALEDPAAAAAAGGDEHTHVHVHTAGDDTGIIAGASSGPNGAQVYDAKATESRFKGIEDSLAAIKDKLGMNMDAEAEEALEEAIGDEVAPAMKDHARRARDSAPLAESFQATLAGAEILAPGIRVPAFDRAADKTKTYDSICRLRKTALDLAYHQPEMRGVLEDLNGGRVVTTDGMTCAAAHTLFNAAVAMKKTLNNGGTGVQRTNDAGGNKPLTLADLNKRNSERWARK